MIREYKKYLVSKYDWIGKYPVSWKIIKLKYLLSVRSGESISALDLSADYKIPVYGGNGIMGFTNKVSSIKNEIIIGRVGAHCGNIHLVSGEKWISDNALVVDTTQNIEYLTYLLYSINLNKIANKNAQPLITGSMVKDQLVPFPRSVSEQVQIVKFLDYQTGIIDELIAKKERLIDLLKEKRQAVINEAVTKGLDANAKMKDSGIEWLGEVPEGWYTTRFNRGIELLTDFEANGSFDDIKKNVEFTDEIGFAWYVRATDLENNNIIDKDKVRWVNRETYYFLSKTKLVGKELLIAKRGEIGKVYLMPETGLKATLAPNLYLVRLNNKLNPNFMWFYFESTFGKKQLVLKNRSVTIGAIYKDSLKEIDIIYPPLFDQLKIVDYLNNQCENISNIISRITSQMEKLKEYRQSIISEAVTGKIDVREWEPPNI